MNKYRDDDFGKLVYNIRKTKKIKAEALVNGICSVKVLHGIEAGEVFPDYLLRNSLIARMGLAPEWFENMLTLEEYEEWQLRDELVNTLGRSEYDKAEFLLENYRKKYVCQLTEDNNADYIGSGNELETDDKLRMQFYLTMKGIRSRDESSYYEMAAAVTSDIYGFNGIDASKLTKYKLSINELNLYTEAAWLSGEKAKAENTVTTIIEYMDKNYYDAKEKSKLFSKLVVYYCHLNKEIADADTLSRMWKLCKNAVDMLRADKKSYYMVELFDIQLELADKLCMTMSGDIQKECHKSMIIEKERITAWRDVLAKEYRERGLSPIMVNDSFIYREGRAYCINDVIRARRSLLGINRRNLVEGICAEKTIEKTEQHRSSLQYTNMKRIYDRLNLPCTYQNSSIIARNIADLEKEEEMWKLSESIEPSQALAILTELKSSVPDYAYNRQALGMAEMVIMRQLGRITTEEALESIMELVELTIPLESIDTFVKNRSRGIMKNERVNKRVYFTSAEINCLLLIGCYYSNLGNYDNAEYYMRLLYEYFMDNAQYGILYGAESIFRLLIVNYSSLLGNCGKYELSNSIADMSAKLQMELNRPQKIWWHKYNNLWNDNVKEKDKEKYNSVLMECATLCQIYEVEAVARIFTKKII